MKILLESHQLFSKNKTGVGYYEKVLTEQLEKVIADSNSTLTHGLYSDTDSSEKTKHKKVVSKYSSKVIRKLLTYNIALKSEQVWKEGFDAYIYPDYFSSPSRKKTAVTVHDLTFLETPEYMADSRNKLLDFVFPGITTALRRVVPRSIENADVVIAISETMRMKLIDTYRLDKDKVIAQAIPPSKEFTNKKIKKPANLKVPTKSFMYYQATLEPRKNHIALLKAYLLLPQDTRRNLSLVLAGKIGWKCEESLRLIEKMKREGENILHIDYATEDERLYLYQHALFYIQPSHNEGFGMPLLEAMACGTPVICSDIDIFREVCSDAALYFDKESPESIKEVILNIVNNLEVREKLIVKGNGRVKYYRSDLSGLKQVISKLGTSVTR